MFPLLLTVFLAQATYIDLSQDGQRLLNEGKYVPALKVLAEVYVRDKRFPEAIDKYEQIIGINPKDITARGHLAELYSWTGNYDKSIVLYKDALHIDPQNAGLKTGLAKVLRWSQRYDEAEALYRDVLQTDPNNHEALSGLAKTYAMMGDLASAVGTLDNAIRLYPDDPELYKEKGTVLAWQKNFKKAIEVLQKGIAVSPAYAETYRVMGDVYSWMKDYQRSIESYKKAAFLEPNNVENHILLARVYRTMGKDGPAETAVKAALRINPSDPQALNLLHEIRGHDGYNLIEKAGDALHVLVYLFTLVVVFLGYKNKKRMLRRRHGAYTYFSNLLLPALIVITSVSYLSKGVFSQWVDASLIEDVAEALLFFSLGTAFLSLLWIEHRSKEFAEPVLLAVGAHPDDIELGCGGILMKARDTGAKVYGLTLTQGEKGTMAGRNGKRTEELIRAAKFMELDGFWVMDLQDTGLRDDIPRMKDIIEEKIRETRATMVLTHTGMDIHSDHQAVFEATKEAARDASILTYEDVSTPKEFVPNYYVDITGYIEDKMRLITFHKTQEEKTYMDPEVIKGRAAHRGLQCGASYAEAFRVYKLLR
ncbi:MAG: tetratricopeptide repeat protein [Nitrospirae bacterium]|nr:tetratricopeptide repeat protein [Nitrospirota bacterium]